MHLVLDIATSVEFWRQRYPLDRSPQSVWATAPSDCAYRKEDVWRLAPEWINDGILASQDGKLHALAFDRSFRRKSNTHVVHTWSGSVPPKSFHKLSRQTLVMSPCFMFLMAANILPINKLIAFGDELCGLYSFDAREERGFRKREVPLITRDQLRRYLETASSAANAREIHDIAEDPKAEGPHRTHNSDETASAIGVGEAHETGDAVGTRGAIGAASACRGCDRAMTALRYIVDGSASPMETFDQMVICLPYRMGGYNLPDVVMNHEIPLSEKARKVAQRKTCYADMCYPTKKLDIEHHGKLDHSSPEDVASDYARKAGLREMGFEVIELTTGIVEDLEALEIVVAHIAKRIGKRLDKSKLGPTSSRIKLRHDVWAWNRSSGRIR